jgi:hypothetical protein
LRDISTKMKAFAVFITSLRGDCNDKDFKAGFGMDSCSDPLG